jgi:Mg-chelatase subunit ChlD
VTDEAERLRRWRLVLGEDAQEGLGCALAGEDRGMDRVLAALYGSPDSSGERSAGLGSSAPGVTRWLGDIRTYFPSPVVRVMQKDALERLGLQQMLLEPEMLEAVEPDVHLVATLISLGRVIPEGTKDSARRVVRKVVEELERRLAEKTVRAVRGSLDRAARTSRPRPADIDWDRTIRANLKTYQPEHRTIIPEKLVGNARRRKSAALRDIILCVDQSGSMASSVVYSGIFGAVLASIRAVNTRMITFDTSVADLTEDLQDPVDLLFGVQLGGGTDINRALAYCQSVVSRPSETVLVLITDLYEGGNRKAMLGRAADLTASGVNMVCLLALSDDGAPSHDPRLAAALANLGVPAFACTPDLFPDMMAAAIQKQDLDLWAARNDIVTARGTT